MEKALAFLWVVWFNMLELGGNNNDTGFHIND
jgi:hypothetical protein